LYRQGDILIIPTTQVPEGLKPIKRDKHNRLILAEGETTGHAHAIQAAPATLFQYNENEMADRFLSVKAEGCQEIDAWLCSTPWGSTCYIPTYEPHERIEKAGLEIIERQSIPGVVVEHEEHMHFVVLPGDAIIRRQSEYEPEAPRYVTD